MTIKRDRDTAVGRREQTSRGFFGWQSYWKMKTLSLEVFSRRGFTFTLLLHLFLESQGRFLSSCSRSSSPSSSSSSFRGCLFHVPSSSSFLKSFTWSCVQVLGSGSQILMLHEMKKRRVEKRKNMQSWRDKRRRGGNFCTSLPLVFFKLPFLVSLVLVLVSLLASLICVDSSCLLSSLFKAMLSLDPDACSSWNLSAAPSSAECF